MSGETRKFSRRTILKGAAAASGALLLKRSGVSSSLPTSGPSTTAPAYALPSLPHGVEVIPILTTGDAAANGYRMVGIPDGLGAWGNGKTFSLVMHHELGAGNGVLRAHGSKGAFVSKRTIERNTLEVLHGEDLIPSASNLWQWNAGSQSYATGTKAFDRLCSADLPVEKAFLHGNRGTDERIFLGGEEVITGAGRHRQ